MTAATAARPDAARFLRRNAWTIGVWLLFALGITWYALIIPTFGPFVITSIAKGGLTLAILAIAQGIVVINGGVDLSIGSMLVLVNCVSARFMDGQDLPVVLLIAALVLIGAALADGLMGLVIHVSRVPDIVVTLAMSFVYSGLALWVLPSPGGGTHPTFRFLFTGSETGIGTNFVPPLVVLALTTVVVWLLLKRTRTGLSVYATGSSATASFLAGVDIRRSKIAAYAMAGVLAALAGLATTAITGGGEPRATIAANATLNSVAAVVLGGIALTGGIGSIVGAVAAGYTLFMLGPVLTTLGVDPNTAQVVQGVLLVLVVMVAGVVQNRRVRA
jgi:ribose transport system permease protein